MEQSVKNRNPTVMPPAVAAGPTIRHELRKGGGAMLYVVLGNPFDFYTIAFTVYYNVRVVETPAILMGKCLQG